MTKNTRLGTMMFLQYALWGAWLPVTARYLSASIEDGGLGFSGSDIGMILGLAGSIGAIAAPFIAGQFADRYFSTEKVLAFLVFTGGLVKWYTSTQPIIHHGYTYLFSTVYCICQRWPYQILLPFLMLMMRKIPSRRSGFGAPSVGLQQVGPSP